MSLSWMALLLALAAVAVIVYFALRARKGAGPDAAIERYLATLERGQADAGAAVHRVVTAYKQVRDRVQAYEEESRRWGQMAREALHSGDEAAARQHVARQVQAEHSAAALAPDLEALAQAKEATDARYASLKQQAEQARVRYASLSARQAAAGSQNAALDVAAEERRAAEAYDGLRDQVIAAESRAAAAAEVSAAGRIYDDPTEIDRRLAALRAQ